VSGALRRFLEQGGFEVKVAPSVDEALAGVKGFDPEVVFTSATHALDGEALCARVKLLSPSCPVVLVYPPEEDAAEARAAAAGADACLWGRSSGDGGLDRGGDAADPRPAAHRRQARG